jgi:hypothetical protein
VEEYMGGQKFIETDIIRKYIQGKELNGELYIEGKGMVREYGKLNLEHLIKRLLQSKHITG